MTLASFSAWPSGTLPHASSGTSAPSTPTGESCPGPEHPQAVPLSLPCCHCWAAPPGLTGRQHRACPVTATGTLLCWKKRFLGLPEGALSIPEVLSLKRLSTYDSCSSHAFPRNIRIPWRSALVYVAVEVHPGWPSHLFRTPTGLRV